MKERQENRFFGGYLLSIFLGTFGLTAILLSNYTEWIGLWRCMTVAGAVMLVLGCILIRWNLSREMKFYARVSKDQEIERQEEIARLREAMQLAKSEPKKDALNTLYDVGIFINPTEKEVNLPDLFWGVGDNELIASTLVTLGRGVSLDREPYIHRWAAAVIARRGMSSPGCVRQALNVATIVQSRIDLAGLF